jgi:hypothetical protein
MLKIKEVEFLGRKVSIVTHGPSGPCPLTALGASIKIRDSVDSLKRCSIAIRPVAGCGFSRNKPS